MQSRLWVCNVDEGCQESWILPLRFTMKVTVCLDMVSMDFLFVFSVTLNEEAKCSVQTYPQIKSIHSGSRLGPIQLFVYSFLSVVVGSDLNCSYFEKTILASKGKKINRKTKSSFPKLLV